MSCLDLFLPTEKTAGKTQIAFDHARVYQQLGTGNGPETLSAAALAISREIVEQLDAMDQSLHQALSNCQAAWKGDAADQAAQAVTPLTKSVREAKDISKAIGEQMEVQIEHFDAVRTMPPPKKVQPLDLGIGGYTPGGFLTEQVDKEIQERQANAVEETARQQYTTYQESTTSTTGNMARYAPVPKPLTKVSAPQLPGLGRVDPNIGHGDSPTSSAEQPEKRTSGSDTPIPPEQPDLPHSGMPDETNQAGSAPLPPGQGFAHPSPGGPLTSGPPGASGDGALPAAGYRLGADRGGGPSSPRGRASSLLRGPGVGSATPGGRPGSSSSTAPGVRGMTAAGIGGPVGEVQRGRSAEDQDHERKYIDETDEHFEFDGETDPNTGQAIAPPVIGGTSRPLQGEEG